MPVLRTRSLSPLIEILHRFDLDPKEIVDAVGLDLDQLAHPRYEDRIDLRKSYDLLELAAEKTRCHYIGALLGSEEKLSLLGPIGLLMEHSPDVDSALKVMIKNRRMQQTLAEFRLEQFDRSVWFTFNLYESVDCEGARHFVEAGVFALARILQIIIGPDFRPDKLCFAHAAPADLLPYRRLAQTEVSFSEEENAILFSKQYLTRRRNPANQELGQALSNYLELLRGRSSDDLLTHLDYIVQQQLRSGPCTLPQVANELRMHPRNLQRQLKAMGTSFSETLAAYRSRRAIELLKDPGLQITQIALRLGYSDATAFGQAFKKWFGKMPRDYRKQIQPSTNSLAEKTPFMSTSDKSQS